MHPRVAARIGIRLIAIYFVLQAVSGIVYSWWSLLNYIFVTRPQLQQQTAILGSFPQVNNFPREILFAISPVLQIVLAVIVFLRADAVSRWIAPAAGRLCGDCGYDLKGITGETCPECGGPVQTPGKSRDAGSETSV